MNPAHAEANTELGDILMRRKDLAGARRLYERAIAADPKLPSPHHKLSRLLFREHDRAGAERESRVAKELEKKAVQESREILRIAWPEGKAPK